MGSSGTTQQPVSTTTQSKDPWSGAQPYLSSMFSTAENMRNTNTGYQPYQGQTVAGDNPYLTQGMGAIAGMAQGQLGGPPGVQGASDLGQSLIGSQGISGNQADALSYLGPLQRQLAEGGGGSADVYRNVINQAGGMQEPGNIFRDIYNHSTDFRDPESVYRNVVGEASGQENPYLQQLLEKNNRQIGDRINSSMSGSGRYGSGQHTDVMARSLAEANAPILAQDYEARQQRKMQGAQGIQNAIQGRIATAAQGGQGLQGALAAQLGLMGQGAQGLGQTAGQRAGILGGLNEAYGQGLNRAGQWGQMIPQLNQAQYAPAESLMGLGEYGRSREQQTLDAAAKKYNVEQAYPWEQLFRESGILGGAGGLGGTTVTGVSQPKPSTLQSILGGGLAGGGIGSAFGPWGAGIGAAGGGLMGLLG